MISLWEFQSSSVRLAGMMNYAEHEDKKLSEE